MKPITPNEANLNRNDIPEFVIQGVNDAIKKYYKKDGFIIKQDDIINEILKHSPGTTRSEIFKEGWLNFEDLYSEYGWDVNYESPCLGENFKSFFQFEEKNVNQSTYEKK